MEESNLTEVISSACVDLKKEIAKYSISFLRWFAAMLIAQAALIATLAKLL